MLTKNCIVCGKEFIKSQTCSSSDWLKRKACSVRCENIRRKGLCFSPATTFKKGIIPWSKENMKGVHSSPKTEFKKGQKAPNPFKKGHIPWNTGIELKEIQGDKHHNWKGGVTELRASIRSILKSKEWRRKVFARDNYICKECGARRKKGDRVILEAHHIKPFYKILTEYEIKTVEDAKKCKELWDIKNGKTLCVPCHKQTDSYSINQHTL